MEGRSLYLLRYALPSTAAWRQTIPPDQTTPPRQPLNVARQLLPLSQFLLPYWRRIIGASVALAISSATMLALGQGLRYLVDAGLKASNTDLLDRAVGLLLVT